MTPIRRSVWKNNKTGDEYVAEGTCINATNAQAGQTMVVYRRHDGRGLERFCRELSEFRAKFTYLRDV